MATLNLYKTYSFKNKDPVIDELRTIIKDQDVSYQFVSDLSGVSVSTLQGWFNGVVRRPQHATIKAVAIALDHEYVLRPKKGR
jgi:transcriptional regulator with XRE-family HTH domain